MYNINYYVNIQYNNSGSYALLLDIYIATTYK